MTDDLPTTYDLIVVGTGLVESMVSAAASRIGKRVLHIDPNRMYGRHWATLNLEELIRWADSKGVTNHPVEPVPADTTDLKYVQCQENETVVTDVVQNWYEDGGADEAQDTKTGLLALSRKFNLDLAPKVMLSKGPMVDVLLQSHVHRYLEFFLVNNLLLYHEGTLMKVPCSKSEMFSTRSVSIVNKRRLMKLFNSMLNNSEADLKRCEKMTMEQYLTAQNIPENLQNFIIYSIAMSEKSTNCMEGVRRAKLFLKSLASTGNSPFLWPLYGSSEILQAFCRFSAVFGGTYCLNRPVNSIVVDKEMKTRGIYSKGQYLQADHVVMSCSLVPDNICEADRASSFQRGILITRESIFPKGKLGVTLVTYPFDDSEPVTLIELHSKTMSVPEGYFVTHLTTRKTSSDYTNFNSLIQTLYQTESDPTSNKPRILYSLFFTINGLNSELKQNAPLNLFAVSGPSVLDVDFTSAIKESKNIFSTMYPNVTFLEPPEEQEDSFNEYS